MRKIIVLIIKWLIATISVTCLRVIKSFFFIASDEFKQLLRNSGFHTSVVNNPHIVFKNKETINLPYNNWLIRHFLSVFYLSVKYKCWKKETKCFYLLKLISLQDVYIYNTQLLFETFVFSPYKEITVPNMKSDKQNVVVYSVMIGDYDSVFDPVYISDNCDYILFTDQIDLKLDIWKIVYVDKVPFQGKTNKWISTYYKVLAHKILDHEYVYSIYVDTKVFVCGDIVNLLNNLDSKYKLALIKHTFTQTLFKEMKNCVDFGYADKIQTQIQYEKYIRVGFPDNLGMIDSCILIREHTNGDVIKTMETWFEEFLEFSSRDQFSIMYAVWKTGINYKVLEGSVWSNQFAIIKKHK